MDIRDFGEECRLMKGTYIKHGLCIILSALFPKTSVAYSQKQLL